MTTITVYTSADGAVRGFLASGHAGGKKIRGYDLVCCAVSALTVQDVARQDELAVRTLRAEALRLAVAAVVGRTGALLMSEELKIHRKHLLASILLAVSE